MGSRGPTYNTWPRRGRPPGALLSSMVTAVMAAEGGRSPRSLKTRPRDQALREPGLTPGERLVIRRREAEPTEERGPKRS